MADRARRVHCCSVFAHPETITTKKEKEKKNYKKQTNKKPHFFSYSKYATVPPIVWKQVSKAAMNGFSADSHNHNKMNYQKGGLQL